MMCARHLLLAVALVSAGARASAQVAPGRAAPVSALPDSEARRVVEPILRPDSAHLMQPVFVGPFGPAARTAVTVIRSRGRCSLLALMEGEGGWRRVSADSLQRPRDGCWQILAVMADNLDTDADREIIVLGRYELGVDSAQLELPFLAAAAFDWNGRAFVRLPTVERSIQGLPNAREIRSALRTPTDRATEPERALPDSEARRLFAPFLRSGERLWRPAIVGAIGPGPETAFALVETADGPRPGFRALALAHTTGEWRAVTVPPIDDDPGGGPSWMMFLNLDADADLEILVHGTYASGIGPTGAVEWPRNRVLDWNGQAFVRVPAVERVILEASDLDEVLRALAAPPRQRRP